jgi:integrase
MSLGKQAKTLSKGQVEAVLGYLAQTRHAARNRVIFLLSAKAGLRAKEIARLTWWMANDSQGEIGRMICLQGWPWSSTARRSRTPVPRDQHREVVGHLAPGDRKPVPPLVPTPRLRGMLQPQRQADLHHQRGTEDLDGRRIAQGRPSAGRTQQPPDHAAIHRREPRGSCSDS